MLKKRYLVFFLTLVCFMLAQWENLSRSQTNEAKQSVRKAAYKGSWYPALRSDLERTVQEALKSAHPEKVDGRIIALISPHAGYRYAAECAAYAYKCITGKNYNRVFILGFSHRFPIRGAAVSDFDIYETPLGPIRVDKDICTQLLRKDIFLNHRVAEEQEHSIEMQLPFLQTVLKDFTVIPLLIGELQKEEDYKTIAVAIKEHIDERTLIVVSSDMTHYGPNYSYVPFQDNLKENLKALNSAAIARMTEIDFKGFQSHISRTGDTICGDDPIGVLLNLLDKDSRGVLLKYSTSGEIVGDYKNSVSYAAIAFVSGTANGRKKAPAVATRPAEHNGGKLSNEEQTILLKLARDTISGYLAEGLDRESLVKSIKLTENLKEKRGVFVTIKKHGELRGCIGYVQGIEPLYQAVIDNAISASTKDYRFPSMKAAEVGSVKLEISVMTPLAKIRSIDEIKVGTHGLYLSYAGRHGILLPQVATENGWDRDEFLSAVCNKAGLPRDTWKKANPDLWIFSAQVFGEE